MMMVNGVRLCLPYIQCADIIMQRSRFYDLKAAGGLGEGVQKGLYEIYTCELDVDTHNNPCSRILGFLFRLSEISHLLSATSLGCATRYDYEPCECSSQENHHQEPPPPPLPPSAPSSSAG